jgi:hypothetical protein
MSYVEGIYEFSKRNKEMLARSLRSLTHSLTHYKQVLIVTILFSLAGCIGKNNIEVTLKNPNKATSANLNVTVANVQVINNQIIITGTNLSGVSNFDIKDGATTTNVQIESKTNTSIIANTFSNMTFAAGKMFDFVLSSASAASTFTVTFTPAGNSITAPMLTSMGATKGQIMKYNGITWVPSSITNAQTYLGTWDANANSPDLTSPSSNPGDYFIVAVAGTLSSVSYAIGDWIISDGYNWQKVANSAVVVSTFNGRRGMVTLLPADYVSLKDAVTHKVTGSSLNDLADVDLTATLPLNNGDVLKYNSGTGKWGSGAVVASGGTVTSVSGTAPISVATGTTTPVISMSAAATAANGYLTSADWNTFNGKEPGITAQAITKVFRGDKTFVTLDTSIVPENGNLYYTDVRALAAPITAPTLTNSSIATSDTIQIALGKLQAQFNNVLNIALTSLSTATSSAITAADSILVALGKLQAQITSTNASYVAKAGGSTLAGTTTLTGTIAVSTGLGRITIVDAPAIATDVANKAYVDSATSGSNPQTPSAYSPSCPTGYVSVPAIAYYPGPSFCVMKYEAKTGSNAIAATTAATGTPVASINRTDARASCRLIGAGYDLISNAQWQTIARNIADQATNWSTGTVYSGELSRGHSDNVPANSLAASTDNDGCNGTGQTCSDVLWDSQRRTNTLSNGEVIWDFAGNVLEWVSDNNAVIAGADGYISTMSAGDKRQVRYGNDQFCATPSSTPYCGMGNGYFNYSGGAFLRGGAWNGGVDAGVFAADLSVAPTAAVTGLGFRCVFVP